MRYVVFWGLAAIVYLVVVVICSSSVCAQGCDHACASRLGIHLAPGEVLTTIEGRPVQRSVLRAVSVNGDQAHAQQEANYMAQRGICGHVGGTIGGFEGVGCASRGRTVPTCTPRRRMNLTADATACRGGMCYRVRAWR